MIARLIRWSVANRFLVLLATVMLTAFCQRIGNAKPVPLVRRTIAVRSLRRSIKTKRRIIRSNRTPVESECP